MNYKMTLKMLANWMLFNLDGKSNKEITSMLRLSEPTVSRYLQYAEEKGWITSKYGPSTGATWEKRNFLTERGKNCASLFLTCPNPNKELTQADIISIEMETTIEQLRPELPHEILDRWLRYPLIPPIILPRGLGRAILNDVRHNSRDRRQWLINASSERVASRIEKL